jgi:hypothetical protein
MCECAVDGGPGDAEQVADLADGVLPRVHQLDQVSLVSWAEPGLFAPQMPLGLGDPHPFPGAGPDQVGLELGHHR